MGGVVEAAEEMLEDTEAAEEGDIELQKIGDGIIALTDKNPVPSAIAGESKIVYYMMNDDYYRYLAELATAEAKSKAADVPVVLQRQVPVIRKVQKTVGVPQVQCVDEIIDVPVVMQRQILTSQSVQQTVELSQVQLLERVEDVPVVMQRQAPQERIQERIVEETDVPVSRVTEKIIEGMKPIPQEHVRKYTVEQTVDVPVPQFLEKCGERIQLIPQDPTASLSQSLQCQPDGFEKKLGR